MSKTSQICCPADQSQVIQQEGAGWRLCRDPSRGDYSILIGGEDWGFELKEPEWRGLVDLVVTLQQQHADLVGRLMAEEEIELELDRGLWWGCLSGDRVAWELRIVLTPMEGRAVEGRWPAPAAAAMVAAMRAMWDCSDHQLS